MPNGLKFVNVHSRRFSEKKPTRGALVRVAICTRDVFDMGVDDMGRDSFYIGHGLVIRKLDHDEHDEFDAIYRDAGIEMYRVLMFDRQTVDTFCEHDLQPITPERIVEEPETNFLNLITA